MGAASRLCILLFWTVSILLFLVIIPLVESTGWLRQIVIRKLFHFFACFLFVPAAILEPRLLSVAYAVATALLVVVEAIRLCKEWMPMGRFIDAYFRLFVDSRELGSVGSDGGKRPVLVLTPIYLLVGCAVPHWVSEAMLWRGDTQPEEPPFAAMLKFAGILCVGIGDAVAAIFGSTYGTARWPGTKRTFDGSLGFFVSMFMGLNNISLWTGLAAHAFVLRAPAIPLVFFIAKVALVEAYTTQIDNLVLPLFTATAMVLMWLS